MNISHFVKPEIIAQLPAHQAIETDGKGTVLVRLPSGALVPVGDLVKMEDNK